MSTHFRLFPLGNSSDVTWEERWRGDWIDLKESDVWDPAHFVVPTYLRDAISGVVIPKGLIMDRVERLAQHIVASDPGPLTLVCVLKGGFSFFSLLADAIKRHSSREGHEIPIRMEFIKCESYHGTESGDLKILTLTDLDDLRGENLLLVEDIVDTGKTLVKLIKKLETECQPKTIKVATMVLKKTERSNGFIPDYVGFAVPDLFIIGFGLDYNEHGREVGNPSVVCSNPKLISSLIKHSWNTSVSFPRSALQNTPSRQRRDGWVLERDGTITAAGRCFARRVIWRGPTTACEGIPREEAISKC